MARKEKRYHFIYKTTDTRNNNYYIGMHSTDNLNDGYVGSGKRIRNIKYRYGVEILKLEILEFLPNRKLLSEREAEVVNSNLLNDSKCMNLRTGGDGGGFISKEHIKNTNNVRLKKLKEDSKFHQNFCDNVSVGVQKSYTSGNRKKRIGNGWNGKKHSPETKKKMSNQKKNKYNGIENSQYGTMWITNGFENKKIKVNENIPLNWYKGRHIN